PVRERLARRAAEVIARDAWVVDDTGFVKDGAASPGVALPVLRHVGQGRLAAERRRRRTRWRRRALGCYRQAVLILRWFVDGTRLAQLAADNAISASTGYRYLHEGIDALAAQAPGLRGALLAARAAGHTHVHVDGTLIRTDRCHV